jgi:glycosyltransferase involved in cell wall biosynthesis
MKLLYIADGRSPIALNWLRYFIHTGHEVHLVSSYPCQPEIGLSSFEVIPVALSGISGRVDGEGGSKNRHLRQVVPVGLRTLIRQWIGPLTLSQAARQLQDIIEQVQPDFIHAMRIPYEGMLACLAMKRLGKKVGYRKKAPLLISVWGNDFTLHARSTPLMAYYTRMVLHFSDALHTDCQRDQRLALEWGFESKKPRIVLPGAGGVQMDIFYPPESRWKETRIPSGAKMKSALIINPRGFRAYVRNDTFFRAIPLVLDQRSDVHFICPAMLREKQAQKWIAELQISSGVDLLPPQSRQQMADLFRQAKITVSITTHDGTPNTLLEALACGCFPIVGDIESLREWITPGVNGLLVDPGDPNALARAILTAISQPELLQRAREQNLQLVNERAEYGRVMRAAEEFYSSVIHT